MEKGSYGRKTHTVSAAFCWCLTILCVLAALGSLNNPAAAILFLLAAAAACPPVHRRMSEAKPWMFVLAFLVCVMAAGSVKSEPGSQASDDGASSSLSGEPLSEDGSEESADSDPSALDAASDVSSASTGTEDENAADPQTVLVYVTENGEKYHLSTCRYVEDGGIELSLAEAQEQGYTPCKVCCPPE